MRVNMQGMRAMQVSHSSYFRFKIESLDKLRASEPCESWEVNTSSQSISSFGCDAKTKHFRFAPKNMLEGKIKECVHR